MNTTNDPPKNVSKSTIESKKRLRWLRNRKLVFAIIIFIALVVIAAWYVYKNKQSDDKQGVSTSTPYSFDDELGDRLLANHLLNEGSKGSGILFKVPLNGFVYTGSPLDRSDPRRTPKKLSDILKDQGNNVELGQRIVTADLRVTFQAIIAAKIVPPADQAKFIRDDYFKELLARLSFNTSPDSSMLGLAISGPAQFTNSYIKSNGQIYEVAALMPKGTASSVVDYMIGQLVEVKGKNATYYLLIAAIDENWKSSPKTWQAIKDSIKVDQ